MTKTFNVKVEEYSGYKKGERPIAFAIGEKRFEVRKILDRWYGEDDNYFKVEADNKKIYILKYNREDDEWDLAAIQG